MHIQWVCWPGSCGGEKGEEEVLHKEISRGLLILGWVGGRWKESAEVADIFGLVDKINTFSCIMMSKSGENFNAYLIGKASA